MHLTFPKLLQTIAGYRKLLHAAACRCKAIASLRELLPVGAQFLRTIESYRRLLRAIANYCKLLQVIVSYRKLLQTIAKYWSYRAILGSHGKAIASYVSYRKPSRAIKAIASKLVQNVKAVATRRKLLRCGTSYCKLSRLLQAVGARAKYWLQAIASCWEPLKLLQVVASYCEILLAFASHCTRLPDLRSYCQL